MRAEQQVTVTFTEKEARQYCKDIEVLQKVLQAHVPAYRDPGQVMRLADLFRDMGLGVKGSYEAARREPSSPPRLGQCEDGGECENHCGTGPCSRRCLVCQRLAGMPTAPCPACPDYVPPAAGWLK